VALLLVASLQTHHLCESLYPAPHCNVPPLHCVPPVPAGEDRRACGARSLGELVRKMGERVLHRMLPILRDGMASPVAATRQGVCAGLKEVRRDRMPL
jgi:hypothetical protein